mmetsp:Transcript_99496/g.167760  ORF Transcript_99496/g.167760 Transcript_99496/m.167760 type:complete len:203 (-) Transcript_99496:170-778(-)
MAQHWGARCYAVCPCRALPGPPRPSLASRDRPLRPGLRTHPAVTRRRAPWPRTDDPGPPPGTSSPQCSCDGPWTSVGSPGPPMRPSLGTSRACSGTGWPRGPNLYDALRTRRSRGWSPEQHCGPSAAGLFGQSLGALSRLEPEMPTPARVRLVVRLLRPRVQFGVSPFGASGLWAAQTAPAHTHSVRPTVDPSADSPRTYRT